jgi:hypothetical protein
MFMLLFLFCFPISFSLSSIPPSQRRLLVSIIFGRISHTFGVMAFLKQLIRCGGISMCTMPIWDTSARFFGQGRLLTEDESIFNANVS